MDETVYVILKVQIDFALEVWFSIFVFGGTNFNVTLSVSDHIIVCTDHIALDKWGYIAIFDPLKSYILFIHRSLRFDPLITPIAYKPKAHNVIT